MNRLIEWRINRPIVSSPSLCVFHIVTLDIYVSEKTSWRETRVNLSRWTFRVMSVESRNRPMNIYHQRGSAFCRFSEQSTSYFALRRCISRRFDSTYKRIHPRLQFFSLFFFFSLFQYALTTSHNWRSVYFHFREILWTIVQAVYWGTVQIVALSFADFFLSVFPRMSRIDSDEPSSWLTSRIVRLLNFNLKELDMCERLNVRLKKISDSW